MILFTLMLTTVLLPMVGLAIDITMLYIAQSKLSAAVDGAALGAGRMLGTVSDATEIKAIADGFVHANFPNGYWGASNVVATVNYTPGITQRVEVSATANMPLLFLRIVGYNNTGISAAGTATRKSSRIVLILDRSGSISNVWTTVKNSAIDNLISKLSGGYDEVGYVAFGYSGIVGYPDYSTRPYNLDPTDTTGGPDTSFLNTGSTSSGPIIDQINKTQSTGNTSMAEALSLAYIELQKAHVRDLKNSGDHTDLRSNAIVLFTDGLPNDVTVFLNYPNLGSPYNVMNAGSKCTNTNPTKSEQYMIGSFSYNQTILQQLAVGDTVSTDTYLTGGGSDNGVIKNSATAFAGCPTTPSTSDPKKNIYSQISRIPARDYYWASTDGIGYQSSEVVDKTNKPVGCKMYASGKEYDATGIKDPSTTQSIKNVASTGSGSLCTNYTPQQYSVVLAAWNLVDNAAMNIRNDSYFTGFYYKGDPANPKKRIVADYSGPQRSGIQGDQNMKVQIFVIGYQGSGGIDRSLLKRVANDGDADAYDPGQPAGKYVPAATTADISSAFSEVASELLRLAQ